MPFEILPVEDQDIETLVPSMFASMGTKYEFINTMYPNHDTPSGQRKIASRFLTAKQSAANTKWIKAVDNATQKTVGVALWTCIDKEKPPEADLDGPEGTWPNETEKAYCRAMHRALLVDRRRMIQENDLPIMILNIMDVFTEHQRKGVGLLLLEMGIKMADEVNALCLVEATPMARRLYEKGGFIVQREYDLDAGEKFADRPKDHLLFMTRPRCRTD